MFEPIKSKEPVEMTISGVDKKVFDQIIHHINMIGKMPRLHMIETNESRRGKKNSIKLLIEC